MRYQAVGKMRFHYPVRVLCRVLRVSASGYYAWRHRGEKPPVGDRRLEAQVLSAHKKARATYGAVRLHKELSADGCRVSLWRVKAIRRRLGLTVKPKRRWVRTTDSRHNLAVAPNLLDRSFVENECNQAWVSDITYIPTGEGFLYLAGIKDLCSRELVGFSLSANIDTDLVLEAFKKAVRRHHPAPGLILHSDRGSQYCSRAYQAKLKHYGIISSMSRKGNCYDNAPMESFWAILKNELVHRRRYKTHGEASQDITEYIELFYNRQRIQKALGYLSPAAFNQKSQADHMPAAA